MKYILVAFLTLTIIPAFAQEPMIGDYLEPSNPSLIIHQTEIPYFEFNKVKSNAVIVEFENIHASSWQIEFHNDLLYGNPDGDAVIRIYDSDIADKFFEIGMGSHPRYSYWIAARRSRNRICSSLFSLRKWLGSRKTYKDYIF